MLNGKRFVKRGKKEKRKKRKITMKIILTANPTVALHNDM